jgi:hypothetical protein
MFREDSITMSELNRYEVIKSLLDGKLTNKEAGLSLQLTVRQIHRIKKRVYGEGVRAVFIWIRPCSLRRPDMERFIIASIS